MSQTGKKPEHFSSSFFVYKEKKKGAKDLYRCICVCLFSKGELLYSNYQASISSLEIIDISSCSCTSFPFCLELAVISPVLSHEMWIFLALIFALTGLFLSWLTVMGQICKRPQL